LSVTTGARFAAPETEGLPTHEGGVGGLFKDNVMGPPLIDLLLPSKFLSTALEVMATETFGVGPLRLEEPHAAAGYVELSQVAEAEVPPRATQTVPLANLMSISTLWMLYPLSGDGFDSIWSTP
jgi:hypothetical protein